MLAKRWMLIPAFILAFFLGFLAINVFILTLPEPHKPQPSIVYDLNGKQIGQFKHEQRVEVTLKKVSPYMQQAVVAIEDERFYKHNGVDFRGIARALYVDLINMRIVEGGSTITQQTAKNIYLDPKRTVGRKIKELILTVQIERKFTKAEILELYLNNIYFGHGVYGIEMAAQFYFDKSAANLNLAESAMLAGIIQSPNAYSPVKNFSKAQERQQIVLDKMVKLEMIDGKEAEKAKKQRLYVSDAPEIKKASTPAKAPYLMNEIRNYLTNNYDNGEALLYGGGLAIYTTIDDKMQTAAERALANGVSGRTGLQGALIAIDPQNGYIRAMVGGRNYQESQYNRALTAKRQPGSAFKPILYAAAIDQGLTQASIYVDEPVEFLQPDGTVYKPTNYGDTKYKNRPFTLKEALAVSNNIVAVRLIKDIGPDKVADYARRLGIESSLKPYLSLALGTSEVTVAELARAYGVLANGGKLYNTVFVAKIVDPNGNVLEENKPQGSQALNSQTAYLVTDMMKAVLQPGGTGAHLAGIINRPAAGKTGTTENYRDAWFAGFTPQLVSAVWVGYDQADKSVGKSGGEIAGPIWANFMRDALAGQPRGDFPVPTAGIVPAKVDAQSGLLATPRCPKTITCQFKPGTEPTKSCTLHK